MEEFHCLKTSQGILALTPAGFPQEGRGQRVQLRRLLTSHLMWKGIALLSVQIEKLIKAQNCELGFPKVASWF